MRDNSRESLVRILLITLVTVLAISIEAAATPANFLHDGVYRPGETGSVEDLLQPVYLYQEQPMMTVNWMYIGFAPRINDPSRVKVIISKQGYTMRVRFEMTEEEVKSYPDYLLARVREMDTKLAQHGIGYRPSETSYYQMQFGEGELEQFANKGYMEIPQMWRLNEFRYAIERYVRPLQNNTNFERAYDLIKRFFPSHTVASERNGSRVVIGHFVYPITITKLGLTHHMENVFPPQDTYYTYALDERRSIHNEYKDGRKTGKVKDDLFNGLPAFWIDPSGKGTGVHGPIRYSEPTDMSGAMSQFWAENNYLYNHQGIDPTAGMNVRFRFEVIRTANSEACFRSEPMELRQLLPSDPNLVKQVPFQVIDEFDWINDRIVDVQYYTDNHYQRADRMAWYRKHYLTPRQKRFPESEQMAILDHLLARTLSLPYLDPASLEFHLKKFTVNPFAMRAFNNAQAGVSTYYNERQELVRRYETLMAVEPSRRNIEEYNTWAADVTEIVSAYNALGEPPTPPIRPNRRDWYSNPAASVMRDLNQMPLDW